MKRPIELADTKGDQKGGVKLKLLLSKCEVDPLSILLVKASIIRL